MKISGDNVLNAPVDRVWDALLDPAVLVRTIPGCERLEATGDHSYAMTVTAGVAAIRGTYAGSCELSDLVPGSSLTMRVNGAGAPGTLGADVRVGFVDGGDGTTRVSYDADAVVGGMVGGVGQRMLTSVSRRMAVEFFGNVDRVLTGTELPVGSSGAGAAGAPGVGAGVGSGAGAGAGVGQVFTAPPRPTAPRQEFFTGIAVGAGLVVLGVVVGSVLGRRR